MKTVCLRSACLSGGLRAASLILVLMTGVLYQTSAVDAAPKSPPNLGELKQQLTQYKASGRYDRDVARVLAKAELFVVNRARGVRKPAIILDIDETSLSNWPQIQANDYGYIANGPCELPRGPCGGRSWEMSAQAEAISATLKLFKAAKGGGIAVFFITGRAETEREATEANLKKVGYDGWVRVIMRPAGSSTRSAADYKAPERAKIAAEGFTIIANIGDQPSDLFGGFAERTYLVPNPFYRIP